MPQSPKQSCCTKDNASKRGFFRRVSDGRSIQRYICKICNKSFSQATFDPAYYQKKRHLNHKCMLLLSSCVSMRRIAIILGIHNITVARKLDYLANQLRLKNAEFVSTCSFVNEIQFDELQTIEHTKCKPLSVLMVVSKHQRKIIGFRVSQMPATGHLAAISRRKYGVRKDDRVKGMLLLFEEISRLFPQKITISSDQCSYYQPIVKTYFPTSTYQQFKSKKSTVSGQGELKKCHRDPLFTINHTFAMCRANINRLIRKTWCVTKKATRLESHLVIYMWVHNSRLTASC